MLGHILPAPWPLSGRTHDHLFAFAPEGMGAPAQLLAGVYKIYRDALPDEPLPPSHKYFGAMVEHVLGLRAARLESVSGLELKRVRSAYACCFEPNERFQFALTQWRHEPEFKVLLLEAREQLIAELIPYRAQEHAQRVRASRYWECAQTAIDVEADCVLDLIKQMAPDDWHEIALRWNWDDGVGELDWITSQPDCDRATALYVLCRGNPGYVAANPRRSEPTGRWDTSGFVLALASRLENGFYVKAELGLDLNLRARAAFTRELAAARATEVSPWQLPEDLLDHPGRAHRPKYTLGDSGVRYHYEYWLRHIAPRASRPKIQRFVGLLSPS